MELEIGGEYVRDNIKYNIEFIAVDQQSKREFVVYSKDSKRYVMEKTLFEQLFEHHVVKYDTWFGWLLLILAGVLSIILAVAEVVY